MGGTPDFIHWYREWVRAPCASLIWRKRLRGVAACEPKWQDRRPTRIRKVCRYRSAMPET